jgi:membrane protein
MSLSTLKKAFFWPIILMTAAKRLYQEQYTYHASALSFTTLLSLVPLISVILTLMTLLPFFNRFVLLTQDYIFANFLPTSSNMIQKYLLAFINQATHLPILGIAFLLFTAITLIIMVEHTLNHIWEAPKRKQKITTMLIYWIILIAMPVVIGFSIAISSYVFSLSWFSHTANRLGLLIPLLATIPLILNTLIFSALYIAVPNCKVRVIDGVIGGLIASILFEAAKKGFAFYLKHFPSYELIYGTLATIPIFLVWVYISWLILLYGALVTHTKYLMKTKKKS